MTARACSVPARRSRCIPVITRHPVTGKKVIFVNTDFTSHINELPRLEGERILQFLVDHCNKPEWTVPLPLDAAFDRVLGQSLHPSQGDLGLLAERPLRLPRAGRGHRSAGRR